MLTIGGVGRATGLSSDVLRIWERRYGFPTPVRDACGDRVYTPDDIAKLRLLRRLVEAGHSPGRIIAKPLEELAELVERMASRPGKIPREIKISIDLLKAHDLKRLRMMMARRLRHGGPRLFITDYMSPLAAAVGEAWSTGELRVFEEHLFSEQATQAIRVLLERIRAEGPRVGSPGPAIAMATLSGETHILGLQMAEVILTLEGCACTSLGGETPVDEFAAAALAKRVDIAAVSYSSAAGVVRLRTQLLRLRELLPASVEIWAGGATSNLDRADVPGVRIIHEMSEATEAVARWRAEAI